MIYSRVAFDEEGKIYFGSDDGNIYAVDTATKEVKWKLPTESRIFLNAPMGPDGDFFLIIPNKKDGYKRDLCILDRTSGQIRSRLEMTEFGTNYSDPGITKDGYLYMGSNYREPGIVYSITVGRKQLMDEAIREQKEGKKEKILPHIEKDETFVDIGGVRLEVNAGKNRQFGSVPRLVTAPTRVRPRSNP